MMPGAFEAPGIELHYLLFVIDVHKFGVHDIVLALFIGLGLAVARGLLGSGLAAALVHGFGQFVAGGGQAIDGCVDLIRVIFVESFPGLFESGFDFFSLGFAYLVAVFFQGLSTL